MMKQLILTATLAFFSPSLFLAADIKQADAELNQAYHEALRARKGHPGADDQSLSYMQKAWITYRDAEANLEAWVAGGKSPDEAKRGEAITQLTTERTAELRHIAKDGVSSDLPGGKDETAHKDKERANSDVRRKIVATHNPELFFTYTIAEQAWETFAGRQSSFDGHVGQPKESEDESGKQEQVQIVAESHFDRVRTDKLKALDASPSLAGSVPDQKEGNKIIDDSDTFISSRKDFRIEQSAPAESEENEHPKMWVVSNTTSDRVRLPDVEGSSSFPSDFSCSPDEHWLFRTQKIVSGVGAGHLYERTSPTFLEFKPVGKGRWDLMAWRFFARTVGYKAPEDELSETGVIHVNAWKMDGTAKLRISLSAKELDDGNRVEDWLADFDLAKKTFAVPTTLKQHNRAAIYKIRP